jgi:Fe2+ or Zn2+ uptake regulation protein
MPSTDIAQRQTRYCQLIEQELSSLHHATNLELLERMQILFPNLSATTVHRATSRLATRGHIAIAPNAHDGSIRYDADTKPHDHILCSGCGKLQDIYVRNELVPIIEKLVSDCEISGNLIISGICKKCRQKEKK